MEERKKKSNHAYKILIVLLLVCCVAVLAVYIDTFYGSGRIKNFFTSTESAGISAVSQDEEKVAQNTEPMMTLDGTGSTILTFGENFLLCTKDGVKMYRTMGDQLWNDTFTMTTPLVCQEGDYAAVGDLSGRSVRVYHLDGLLYEVQTDGTPVQFALNANGYLSVITQEVSGYRISVYNASGNILKARVEESTGVFPLCSDVSDDNRFFAVSYADTSDVYLMTKVLFFYIDAQESESVTDSMFAAVQKEEELIPMISFMDQNTLCAVSDRAIYGIDSSGKESWQYALTNRVDFVSFGNKGQVVFAAGEALSGLDAKQTGTILAVDTSGNEVFSAELGKNVTYLFSDQRGIVVGCDREYSGISNSGKVQWQYTATMDLRDLLPMKDLKTILMVSLNGATVLDMTKENTAQTGLGDLQQMLSGQQTQENVTQDDTSQTEDAEDTSQTSQETGQDAENAAPEEVSEQP